MESLDLGGRRLEHYRLVVALVVLVVVAVANGFVLVQGVEWNDFTGGCLQPAELPDNEVLVFTSPAKVLKAIGRYKQDRLAGTCGEEFREAFERLEWVLDKTHVLKDICGQEAYERIRAFHEEFIHFYVPELTRAQLRQLEAPDQQDPTRQQQQFRWPWQSKQQQVEEVDATASATEASASARPELKPIPVALRQFFINFAKQANAHCKQRLLGRLEALQSDVKFLDPDDWKVIERYKSESLKLSFLYELTQADQSSYGHERESDFNRLEMVDFERPAPRFAIAIEQKDITLKSGSTEVVINKLATTGDKANEEEGDDSETGEEEEDGRKLFLQVAFGDNLKKIKDACRKRFMPIYMELFAPVIRLNNLGYIDRVNSKNDNIKLDESDDINRWFVVIQTCEVLRDIEILHDSSADNAILDLVFAQSHLPELLRKRQIQAGIKSDETNRQEVKILSRKEAEELRAKSEKQQVRPLYDPRVSPVPHQSCQYTPRMWLTEPKACQQQASEFERDVKRMISRKTSLVRNFKRDLTFKLKTMFNTGKRQVMERDESSRLGRMVAFVERHQNLIRGFGLIMSATVLTMSLLG